MDDCEVCGHTLELNMINLGEHPLCDDLTKIGENKANQTYEISVNFCFNCFTAHQSCQPEKEILFPPSYHYRARFTEDVLTGMMDFVKRISVLGFQLSDKKVLDIGCNDGSLLNIFAGFGCKTFGIEPTDAYKDCSSNHTIINNFFDRSSAEDFFNKFGTVDILTFTNVFAHISDLNELLKNCKKLMNKKTILCIENHYLGTILKTNQFDTFYHEHPRTYSLESFRVIAERLGMKLISIEFPERYGGNIRVIMTNKSSPRPEVENSVILEDSESFTDSINKMINFMKKWKQIKRSEILDLVNLYGPLPGKAFPGRSAILIKMLRLSSKEIRAIYEKSGS